MISVDRPRTVNEQTVASIAVLATEDVRTSIGKRVEAVSSTAAGSHAHAISGGFASLHPETQVYQSD